jgi:ubiquinone/menaquinone biosynthesis C-methylase UbiE
MNSEEQDRSMQSLWKIYNRPQRPSPWVQGWNLPWNQPAFSQRMLQEHLDESHGAASRVTAEREAQIDWLWEKLALQPGSRVLDVTCGPGLYAVELAKRGCSVVGIDFSPASIAYALRLAEEQGLQEQCTFVEQDVLLMDYAGQGFDAALFLYGQLAVFPRHEAQQLLGKIAASLKPGGLFCVELLNQERVDKVNGTWWFTDNTGLWGDKPFLHLGERFWLAAEEISVERFQILHLDTGRLDEISLSDQSYAVETMVKMMKTAGLQDVHVYPAWDTVSLHDEEEWMVYIARV